MPLPLSAQENTTKLYQTYTLPTFPCCVRLWLLHGKPPASSEQKGRTHHPKNLQQPDILRKNKTSNAKRLFLEHTSSASPEGYNEQAQHTTKFVCAFCVVKHQHEQCFNR